MHGISIQHLTLPKLKIERLYIKLDKKLTVTAHEINIKRDSKSKNSTYEISKIISYFKYLNLLFKSVSLKNISYDNEKVNLLYKDDIFYINSKYLTLDAKIRKKSKYIIYMDIKQMILKDYKIEFKGDLSLDMKRKIYNYSGKFSILNIDGSAKIEIKDSMLYYKIATSYFKSLNPIMKEINSRVFIEPLANAWIYKKIVAKKYKLNYLKGKIDLKTKEFFPNSIEGSAVANQVSIRFHQKVTPAHAKKVIVTLKNNTLYFNVTSPTYEKKKIGVNDIHIYNILTSKNGIVVDISSKTLLDKHIHNILKNFGIKIPITQTDGKNSSNISLDVKFRPFEIEAKGTFVVKNSHFKLLNLPLYTKYAKIRLDNFNVFLKKSNIVYGDLFDINTTGILKTKSETYSGKIDINSLLINIKKDPVLEISNLKNQNISLKIGKVKNIMNFDNLKTRLVFGKKYSEFLLTDLSKYRNFSTILKEGQIDKGSLDILTKDFKKYSAKLKLYNLKTPLIYHKKIVKDLDVDMQIDKGKITASALHGMLSLMLDKHFILKLQDMDILVDSNSSKISKISNISISGKNVNFLLKDMNSTLLSNKFTMNIFKHSTRFVTMYKDSQLGYEQNRSSFSMHGKNLNSYFLDTILNKKILQGGSFNLESAGVSSDMFNGKLTIKDSILKDFSLFNNIMATINTIPSLLFLKNPNFNEQGYLVKKGLINFKKNGKIISFDKIILHGASADIYGFGYIDLKNKKIDMDLEIKTLKDVSNIIKNIPLVGYVILGEDKSISTYIKVTGKTDNPKISTQILKDTINTPLNIIKRAIQAPFKIFK